MLLVELRITCRTSELLLVKARITINKTKTPLHTYKRMRAHAGTHARTHTRSIDGRTHTNTYSIKTNTTDGMISMTERDFDFFPYSCGGYTAVYACLKSTVNGLSVRH